MDCGHCEKTILYFYGELPPGDAMQVKGHIAVCRSCAAELEMLEKLSVRLRAFSPVPPELLPPAAAPWRRAIESALAIFKRAVPATALAAGFFLVFRLMDDKSASADWRSDFDSNLDNIEYRIAGLENDMAYSSADFDYDCADIENQKIHLEEQQLGAGV